MPAEKYTVVIKKTQRTEVQVKAKSPKDAVNKASLFFEGHRNIVEKEMAENESIDFIVNQD